SVGFLALSAVLLTVNWGSYVWAVLDGRVIETALGYFIAPLGTMAIGVLVLGETPNTAQRVAFVLATVAVVILTISAGRPPWIALVIAGTWSLYALSKRQVALDAIDGMAGETLVLLVPALIALVLMSGGETSVAATADAGDWAFVLGTGVITALPLTLFASAARSIPFTLLGPLNLIVPVIGFGLGWLLYDEEVPLLRFVGFAFVWTALVVVMFDRVASARRASALRRIAAPL
ncbi:MAG: EamA family transporter, partial [Ilumatobacter sp.]